MRRIVWTFGLIAGGIMAAMMAVTIPFSEQIGDAGEIVGYTTMILAFVMVYAGIKQYRDTVAGGTIRFGKAFTVGLLITLVASACYVATWEIIYYTAMPDFAEKYSARIIERERAKGASEAAIEAKRREMAEFAENYKDPFINVAYTFLEVFPVGLVVVLVSAGILSRGKRDAHTAAQPA
ncbi:MAG: DUF4199 domain-containing protein [Gemmatimonadaceae bacterium]|jgi:hypothetical protein|nr:DUF4199 domain-containing protein [Gemmatimonadaceae bacterium]